MKEIQLNGTQQENFIVIKMKEILTIGALISSLYAGNYELLAKDSSGVAIMLKEKYGYVIPDTGTVIMKGDGEYVVVKNDKPSNRYPICNFAILDMKKLGYNNGN